MGEWALGLVALIPTPYVQYLGSVLSSGSWLQVPADVTLRGSGRGPDDWVPAAHMADQLWPHLGISMDI